MERLTEEIKTRGFDIEPFTAIEIDSLITQLEGLREQGATHATVGPYTDRFGELLAIDFEGVRFQLESDEAYEARVLKVEKMRREEEVRKAQVEEKQKARDIAEYERIKLKHNL